MYQGVKGSMPLLINGKVYSVLGGPYKIRPMNQPNLFFVKMAVEINHPFDVSIPTVDFSLPNEKELRDGMFKALNAMLRGRQLFVGCMGGVGRTGLFMATLAKAVGVEHPVQYVRRHYLAHAVETKQQFQFVTNFDVGLKIRARLFLHKIFGI